MRIDGSVMNPGVNVASVMADFNGRQTKFGEVYLYDDGSATVYDDFWGNTAWFDANGKNRHHEAIRYVVTRIVEICELVW